MTNLMDFNIRYPKSSKAAHYLNLVESNIAKNSFDVAKSCYIIQELFDFSETLESIENRVIKCKFETTVK